MFSTLFIDDNTLGTEKVLDGIAEYINIKIPNNTCIHVCTTLPRVSSNVLNFSHVLYVSERDTKIYEVDLEDPSFDKPEILYSDIFNIPCFLFFEYILCEQGMDIKSENHRTLNRVIDIFRPDIVVSDANLANSIDRKHWYGGGDLLNEICREDTYKILFSGIENTLAAHQDGLIRKGIENIEFYYKDSDFNYIDRIIDIINMRELIPFRLAMLFNTEPGIAFGHGFSRHTSDKAIDLSGQLIEKIKLYVRFLDTIDADEIIKEEKIIFTSLQENLIQLNTSDLPKEISDNEYLITFWKEISELKFINWMQSDRIRKKTLDILRGIEQEPIGSGNQLSTSTFQDFRKYHYKLKISAGSNDKSTSSWLYSLHLMFQDECPGYEVKIEESDNAELFIPKAFMACLFDKLTDKDSFLRHFVQEGYIGLKVKRIPNPSKGSSEYKAALIINYSFPIDIDFENIIPGAGFLYYLIKAINIKYFYNLYFVHHSETPRIFVTKDVNNEIVCRKTESSTNIFSWNDSCNSGRLKLENVVENGHPYKYSIVFLFDALDEK